ncbi:helix-hairpin-helix domain-containing protein [Pedobacter sp. ASV12]|uniref:helix-hairpin-helix domain-containing protein n=1 Tax=Pedobacter sp. ASV12 TaxID=2795120 RepID=UPI0018EAACD2|nr:helix-hairpin-helix domain-containing protein [Pedobacter sp. ASV12]
MYFRVLLMLFLYSNIVRAQTAEAGFIKDLMESLAENLPEDYDLFELEDRLIYFSKHPINLNQTHAAELKSLVFLSPLQISNFFAYLKANGPFIDVLELQSIPNFDAETVTRLLPFVAIANNSLMRKPTLKNLRLFGENDLFIRAGRTLDMPKGFSKLTGSKYLGTPERLLLRYKYNFAQRIDAGLIAEKDAGEKWSADFKSAHLAIFNTWRFNKIVLGDYSLQFGQGLTLWSGFAFGKAPDVTSVAKKDLGLRPYHSSNEYAFLRGMATTVTLTKYLVFTGFLSYRKLDASLSLNNEGEEVLTTINETGYHRTESEIKNRNRLTQLFFGGALQYQRNNLNIGLIAHRTNYNRAFTAETSPYRYDDFSGKTLTNLGLHYTYTYRNFYLFGEIAKSLQSGLAYVNGALISLSAKASAVVLYRNYASNYHNFFNQAMAEATRATNERGLYVGLNLYPAKSWAIAVYADYFKFPWLKFRIDAPSDGYEVLGQLSYMPSKTFKIQLRYKSELKQQNTDLAVPINYLDEVKKESYRADVNWQLNRSIGFQNRLEVSQYHKGASGAEFGYLAYQDMSYKPLRTRLSGNIRIAYFNIPSFNSRIYAYEDDVLYSFSFGMYSGKGWRNYLNLKYKLLKRLDIWVRYALSFYPRAGTVGSGLDEIEGNKKSDIKLQFRYQF